MSMCGPVTAGFPRKAQPQLRESRQLTSLWRGPQGPTPPKTDPVLSHSCQCQEYISAEELCDAQCLARATRLSLAWGPSRKLILSMKDEAGSIQRVSPVKGRIGMEGQLCPLEKKSRAAQAWRLQKTQKPYKKTRRRRDYASVNQPTRLVLGCLDKCPSAAAGKGRQEAVVVFLMSVSTIPSEHQRALETISFTSQ